MNKIFRRFLKNHTQGDEEKELWLWNMFYNYEVTIGSVIAVVLCILAYLIIGVFSALGNGIEIFDIRIFLLLVAFALLFGLFAAYFIVSPLLDKDNIRKDNAKQGSFFLATAIGHIANLLINWGPLLVPIISIMRFNWINFIGACVGVVLYYLILGFVKPNAKDYVNWRFNWAIENYELLFSRHYKWWTSSADMSVQKHNLKKFQNYKYHATLSLIMIPLIFLMMLFAGSQSTGDKNKTSQVQVTTDSISVAPDNVENIKVGGDYNDESDLLGSDEVDEVVNENEDMNANNQFDDTQFDDTDTPIKEDNQVYSLGDISEKDNPQFPSAGNNGFSHFKLAVMDYVGKQLGEYEKGSIYVDFKIDKQGKVYDIDTSLTHGQDLRQKVYQIFKGLHFIPAKKDGKPIIVQTNISM